jgi:ribonuclease P protein component
LNQGLSVKIREASAGKKSVSVIVGKNAVEGARERNQLKRRIRAILLPHVTGRRTSVVVVVGKNQGDMTFLELKNKLLTLFFEIMK